MMGKTPNSQRPTSNVEGSASDVVCPSANWRRTPVRRYAEVGQASSQAPKSERVLIRDCALDTEYSSRRFRLTGQAGRPTYFLPA